MKSSWERLDIEAISKLCKKGDSEEILNTLVETFKEMKDFYSKEYDFDKLNSVEAETYTKEVLFTLEGKEGSITFEALSFRKDKRTGPHTHPEFVINEVISGEIEEFLFEPDNNEKYQLKKSVIREKGDLLTTSCCEGYPHDVMSRTDYCNMFALSYGMDCVEMIEPEKCYE